MLPLSNHLFSHWPINTFKDNVTVFLLRGVSFMPMAAFHSTLSLSEESQSPYLETFMEPRNRFRGIDIDSEESIQPGWESIPGPLKKVYKYGLRTS